VCDHWPIIRTRRGRLHAAKAIVPTHHPTVVVASHHPVAMLGRGRGGAGVEKVDKAGATGWGSRRAGGKHIEILRRV
jgi:hypothetical protein